MGLTILHSAQTLEASATPSEEKKTPAPDAVYGFKPKPIKVKDPFSDTKKGAIKPPKNVQEAKALLETIEAGHNHSDDELFEAIQVKPENALKKTHMLEREQLDARLVLMHRLLIRKVAPKDIQAQLGISVELYYYLRPKLDAMMRLDVKKLDVPYLIGDTLAIYDEVRSMALTMASSSQIKDQRVKIAAMSVVLKAEGDKNNFLALCGVYNPLVVEHLIRGMVNAGLAVNLSGEVKTSSKTVGEMVGELMEKITANNSTFDNAVVVSPPL